MSDALTDYLVGKTSSKSPFVIKYVYIYIYFSSKLAFES